jgi:hypothetical protein
VTLILLPTSDITQTLTVQSPTLRHNILQMGRMNTFTKILLHLCISCPLILMYCL